MSPTADDKQIIREKILRQAHASGPRGITAEVAQRGVALAGFALESNQIALELHYLTDKGLLSIGAAALSAGARRFAITAAGIEYLESEGLA